VTATEVDLQEKIDHLSNSVLGHRWRDQFTKRTMCVKNIDGQPWVCSLCGATGEWVALRNITTTCQDLPRYDK